MLLRFFFFFFIICLFACNTAQNKNKHSVSITFIDTLKTEFKERALCDCIALGLDSSRKNKTVQKLKIGYQTETFLFDPIIYENLKPVMDQIYWDSVRKSTTMAENVQGKEVIKFCLEYYNSKELDSLVDAEAEKWRRKYKSKKDLRDDIWMF